MEERAEAQVGEAPAADVEDPEVPRGCKNAMMRICPPCPFGTGKNRLLSWQGQFPHSLGSRYLQELEPVRTVLGGLQA